MARKGPGRTVAPGGRHALFPRSAQVGGPMRGVGGTASVVRGPGGRERGTATVSEENPPGVLGRGGAFDGE